MYQRERIKNCLELQRGQVIQRKKKNRNIQQKVNRGFIEQSNKL